MGFADAQHDQAQDGQEVKGVAGDPVEGDQGLELAEADVDHAQDHIEQHGVDGRVAQADGPVPEEAGHGFGQPGAATQFVQRDGRLGSTTRKPESDLAEEGRDVAFAAGHVDQPAGSKGRCIEGAET